MDIKPKLFFKKRSDIITCQDIGSITIVHTGLKYEKVRLNSNLYVGLYWGTIIKTTKMYGNRKRKLAQGASKAIKNKKSK